MSKTFDKILNELEQEKVGQFIQDDVMREAVKKVILYGIYGQGTLKQGESVSFEPYENFALVLASQVGTSDEQVGQEVKACWKAINLVMSSYKDLEEYKPMEILKVKENKAK